MKVYLDVLFLANFILDMMILLGVKHILKRKTSLVRVIIGVLLGEVSILFLLLPLSSISLFLLKLLLSMLMVRVTFGYYSHSYFKENMIYFYILSTMLGGIVSLLKLSIPKNNVDPIQSGIILLVVSPILLKKYIKKYEQKKDKMNLKHEIDIYLNHKKYTYIAYVDTGNCLKDPYKKRPIVLVNDKRISFPYEESILVPFQTVNDEGVMKCKKPEKIVIDKCYTYKNILIGEAKNAFHMDDVEVILPNIIKEEIG